MELVNIRDIFRNQAKYENTKVSIGGWVRSNRNSKNFGFIVVNDGTFFEPIQELAEQFSTLQSAMASAERILEICDLPEDKAAVNVDGIYANLSAYGHMGREDLGVAWEKTDKTEALKSALGM